MIRQKRMSRAYRRPANARFRAQRLSAGTLKTLSLTEPVYESGRSGSEEAHVSCQPQGQTGSPKMMTLIETSLPRPGRRFEPVQERELHGTAVSACASLPGTHRGLTVVSEMAGPFGVPDFTALVGDSSRLVRRRALGIGPVTNDVDAGIVAVLSSSLGRTEAWIASRLGWPVSTVHRRIPGLLRTQAINEVRPGRYVRHPGLGPIGRLYAVEAKINDWTSALRQVRTYRVWADSYVLVMGKLSMQILAKLSPEVARDAGGLVVNSEWLIRPRLGRVAPYRRLQAAEYFAAASWAKD